MNDSTLNTLTHGLNRLERDGPEGENAHAC